MGPIVRHLGDLFHLFQMEDVGPFGAGHEPGEGEAAAETNGERGDEEEERCRVEGQNRHQWFAEEGEDRREQEDWQCVSAYEEHTAAQFPGDERIDSETGTDDQIHNQYAANNTRLQVGRISTKCNQCRNRPP